MVTLNEHLICRYSSATTPSLPVSDDAASLIPLAPANKDWDSITSGIGPIGFAVVVEGLAVYRVSRRRVMDMGTLSVQEVKSDLCPVHRVS